MSFDDETSHSMITRTIQKKKKKKKIKKKILNFFL